MLAHAVLDTGLLFGCLGEKRGGALEIRMSCRFWHLWISSDLISGWPNPSRSYMFFWQRSNLAMSLPRAALSQQGDVDSSLTTPRWGRPTVGWNVGFYEEIRSGSGLQMELCTVECRDKMGLFRCLYLKFYPLWRSSLESSPRSWNVAS